MNYFNYFTEIEEAFARRRGKHLHVSPLDWELIESWQNQGIPLRIVLRGIDNVFDTLDKNPKKSRDIKSLTYCRDEVESLFEEWRDSQVGKSNEDDVETSLEEEIGGTQPDLFSKPSVNQHLEKLIKSLVDAKSGSKSEIEQALDFVIGELRAQRTSPEGAEELEAKLTELESFLDRKLLGSSEHDLLRRLEKEIAEVMYPRKASMNTEVYRKTFEMMLVKRIRDEAGIPRLSLFAY